MAHGENGHLARETMGIAAALVIASGCGAAQSNGDVTSDGGGRDGGASDGTVADAGGSDAQGGDSSLADSATPPDASMGDVNCPLRCSTDLHDIVDCNGKVVTPCPADQGCAAATCVAACASAIANQSSSGCEYYSVDPDIIPEVAGACFAMFIVNTWTSAVHITADRGGTSLNIATAAQVPSGEGTSLTYTPLGGSGLPPGQVAILFLDDSHQSSTPPDNYACPTGVTAAVTQSDGAVHGTSSAGKAFHIQTDRPVVAYDMAPYGGGATGAPSGTLLLPTSAWGTNYLAVNAYPQDVSAGGQPFLEVVASQANTTVTITPKVAIVAGSGVVTTPQGTSGQYTLVSPGDYLQITQDAELTGSPILADKPIGVWGGATCVNIPASTPACDGAHQELLPVTSLGSEYVAVRYPDRFSGMVETTPWRLVAAVNDTAFTYDPPTLAGAPLTSQAGGLAEFETTGPFVVHSQDAQHPFYLAAYMTGCGSVNADLSDCRGDPEFVNVIAPGDFLSSYVFFTDLTYPETRLVFVRGKGPQGFADVDLDCAGVLSGWAPVGTAGTYEYAQVTISGGDFQGQNGCANGRHVATSTSPFGLTVWGWGSAATGTGLSGSGPYTQGVSYAYPAGASMAPLNSVVVAP